jgi:Zn-dependent M28 family amino/carboxypeptidase
MPALDLSCEDYGLLFRLAENDQSPTIRVNAEAEFMGEVPQYNTIATIPGTELPNEYVLLSAHFDSFDSASGATDNGTGSITMLEAMRILKQAYPNPRRTIMVGHWAGEEQGLNGSRAFAADHPEIVQGLQALFNQDNGTGRVVNISMQGLVNVASNFGDWISRIPQEISGHISLGIPGSPGGGGSDYASFICAGAPAFSLSSLSWDYGSYTWHTNRDTYDKVVIDDLQNNATLTAMLTYLASEDDRLDRTRRVANNWPECRDGARSGPGGD